VCVFPGAASGIGTGTLDRLACMLHAPTFYVVGGSAALFASQRAKLESLNSSWRVVFLEAEYSLLFHVDAACKKIATAERKVDYVYMSAGLIPLNGAQCTSPGPWLP
jgi:NADP-dependent 3-hydroxy acid dehydrogenase YdfG